MPPARLATESEAEFAARRDRWYRDIAQREREKALPALSAHEDWLWTTAERVVLARVERVETTQLRGSEGQMYTSPLVTLRRVRWLKGSDSARRMQVRYLSDDTCAHGGAGDAPHARVGDLLLLFYRRGPIDPLNILDSFRGDRAITQRSRTALDSEIGSAPAPQSVDDAQVDRLIAVLPESATIAVDAADEASELARLLTLNPGRRDEIKAILDGGNECAHAEDRRALRILLRVVTAQLGPEKVERLISFYGSPHYQALPGFAHRAAAREKLSPSEKDELERAEAAYPIREFALALRKTSKELTSTGDFLSYRACGTQQEAALERAKLRTR